MFLTISYLVLFYFDKKDEVFFRIDFSSGFLELLPAGATGEMEQTRGC